MKVIYRKDSGDIIAWVSPDQDVVKFMENWENVDYADFGDISFKRFHRNPTKVDLITKQPIYPDV